MAHFMAHFMALVLFFFGEGWCFGKKRIKRAPTSRASEQCSSMGRSSRNMPGKRRHDQKWGPKQQKVRICRVCPSRQGSQLRTKLDSGDLELEVNRKGGARALLNWDKATILSGENGDTVYGIETRN